MEYVIGKYGHGRLAVEPDAPNFADYLFWLHFANASFMPRQTGLAAHGRPRTTARASSSCAQRAEATWDLVEKRLGEAPYFAGEDFTAADIIMGFTLTTMRAFSGRSLDALSEYSRLAQTHRRPPGLPARDGQRRPGHDADGELASERRPTLTLHPRSGWRDE